MRNTKLVILLGFLSGCAGAQALVEHAVLSAAGNTAGAAGKKVGDSVNKILNKIDAQTSKAAESGKNTTLIDVGPGVPKASAESAPAPARPARHVAAAHKTARAVEPAAETHAEVPAIPILPPPPPPAVTAEDLERVTIGMNRQELLKLGAPASRIMMSENDHLVEIYRYMDKDSTLGVVQLTDGTVSSMKRP